MTDDTFSAALRAGTADAHRGAEQSTFVADLIAGTGSREHYTALAIQQYFIYVALEQVGDALADDPVAGPFVTPELARVPSIERDLACLLGDSWASRCAPLPATQDYVARIREMAQWPGGFVAHHYTRYLGDLAGGQAIRASLQSHYGFGEEGVSFYRFTGIDKPKVFRDYYRSLLDNLPVDAAEKARIVEEARRVFALNAGVFAGLQRRAAAAV